MANGIYAKDFSEVFSKLLAMYNVTCYQISQYTNLDQSYLKRLRTGEKNNPSPSTLFKISLALAHLGKNVRLYDIEELFNAVGRTFIYIR